MVAGRDQTRFVGVPIALRYGRGERHARVWMPVLARLGPCAAHRDRANRVHAMRLLGNIKSCFKMQKY